MKYYNMNISNSSIKNNEFIKKYFTNKFYKIYNFIRKKI